MAADEKRKLAVNQQFEKITDAQGNKIDIRRPNLEKAPDGFIHIKGTIAKHEKPKSKKKNLQISPDGDKVG